jgi:hypothetical protein
MGSWLSQNWFTLLSAVGIVGSLLFTAASFRSEAKTRKIANLLAITGNHRELWKEFSKRPHLARILEGSPSIKKKGITREEEIFVNLVILHMSSVFHAIDDDLMIKLEGSRRDIWWFLSLPIPNAIWEKMKVLQDEKFVEFVEKARGWK